QKTEYFKPYLKEISDKIESITGLNDEFLMDKPFFERKHAEELKNKLEGSTIVAHNAPFDMKFLIYSLYNLGIEHNKFRVYDTLTFSRKYITETKNHKLQTLKEYFNLDSGYSHDALNDAKATGKLALLLIERQNNH
ncbi:DNA polymerase III subunit epsilon, partial [Staphylococcus cohnii]